MLKCISESKGAINGLIIRTVENILIREKSLSEIVLSTLAEPEGVREGNVFGPDLCQKKKKEKLVKVIKFKNAT